MKYSMMIKTLGLLTLSAVLAGCGDDGETTQSTGVDTSTGTGSGSGGGASVNAGRLQFSVPSLTVAENAGNATLTITRTEGSNGAVSVTVATRNGTATQPQHYTTVSTTVSFAAGDGAAKTVTVPIIDNTEDGPDRTLYVTLSSPTGNAVIGATSEVLVTIADDDISAPPASRAVVSATANGLHFDWTTAAGATSYRVMKDAAGSGTYAQVGADLPSIARAQNVAIALLQENWSTARYAIDACNSAGCTRSNAMTIAGLSAPLVTYVKASSSSAESYFGQTLALSADGNTLAVGTPNDNSAATGIGGNENDDCNISNCAEESGAVYVYTNNGSAWSSATYIKAADSASGNRFGADISLSADGNTLAVSATGRNSYRGAVYIFTRSGDTWQQAAVIEAADGVTSDYFGMSVSLNPEGSMLAVGAPYRAAGATTYAGAVYVFSRAGSSWSPVTTLTQPVPVANASFGADVALAGTASAPVLAVGVPNENVVAGAVTQWWVGAAYVFRLNGSTWTATRLDNPAPDYYDSFGSQVALSTDGATLAIASNEDDLIPADPADPVVYGAGAVYVYASSGSAWTAQAQLHATNPTDYMRFGGSLALSADGTALAVGAPSEDGSGIGIDGAPDTLAQSAGAAYFFTRSGTGWSTGRYIRATNTQRESYFGTAVVLSSDGSTLAVSAIRDSSDADNIGGDQSSDCSGAGSNCATNAGAVFIYR